jgi:ATP-binding cassette subfamily B protein
VENNIRFSEDLDNIENLEHFRNIIRAAALEDEVARFPNQENTMVGEKGIMLSGGQKQRISLARAMLKPCDLLILDNVLSAVDYETERYLLREIHKLLLTEKDMAGSILIVSHRVTAMEKSDWILVLDEGQIVDQGVHKDLIQRPGYYQQMWELQNENNS